MFVCLPVGSLFFFSSFLIFASFYLPFLCMYFFLPSFLSFFLCPCFISFLFYSFSHLFLPSFLSIYLSLLIYFLHSFFFSGQRKREREKKHTYHSLIPQSTFLLFLYIFFSPFSFPYFFFVPFLFTTSSFPVYLSISIHLPSYDFFFW